MTNIFFWTLPPRLLTSITATQLGQGEIGAVPPGACSFRYRFRRIMLCQTAWVITRPYFSCPTTELSSTLNPSHAVSRVGRRPVSSRSMEWIFTVTADTVLTVALLYPPLEDRSVLENFARAYPLDTPSKSTSIRRLYLPGALPPAIVFVGPPLTPTPEPRDPTERNIRILFLA